MAAIHSLSGPILGYCHPPGTVGYYSPRVLAGGVSGGNGDFRDRAAIGSLVHVSQPVQVVSHSSVAQLSVAPTDSGTCGRITGMVDCQFASGSVVRVQRLQSPNPKSENPKSLSPLAVKFVLASGLMEITYDTGAKVILQGPVTYEVESAAGGYPVTWQADGQSWRRRRKAERRRESDRNLEVPNLPNSFIPLSSLFALPPPP